jgi:hypothetical protein
MWPAIPTETVGNFVVSILKFLTIFSAIGAVVMAFIQQVKNLTFFRELWQRSQFLSWLRSRFAGPTNRIEDVLIRLSTSGNRKALYELQIEQMTAQLSAAAQFVLDFPNDESVQGAGKSILLAFAPDSAADIEIIIKGPDLKWTMAPSGLTAQDIADRQNFAEAKVRVQRHIQRSIDAIQISIGSKWQALLQWISTILGGGFGVILLKSSKDANIYSTLQMVSFFLASAILSGFLAPVTRDLVAALENLRKP